MSHDDKPFACSATDCGMRFSTEDHLNVHLRKHEMSLALNLGGTTVSSLSNPFLDQTPTPTKFLKNCEEIGLFQELNKNPFEEAFKKASDVPEGNLTSIPIPGPHSNDLNTPVPLENSKNDLSKCVSVDEVSKLIKEEPQSGKIVVVTGDKALDLSGHRTLPSKSVIVQPSSTTSDDESDAVSLSQAADSTVSPARNVVSSTGPDIIAKPVTVATKLVTSPTIIVPHSTALPVASPATTAATVAAVAGSTQSIAMQVFLQLPTGQTVPVHIPATLNPIVPVTIPGMLTQAVPITSSSPVTSSAVTSMNLKQRLKQSLAASQQQTSLRSIGAVSSVVQAVSVAEVPNHILVNSQVSTPTILSEVMSPNSDSPSSVDLDFSDSIYGKRSKSGNEDEADDRRRKFLERNRAAAARCRMKRKHWISNLERKADELQNTNTRLQTEVNVLRAEVAQLKTLLLAHKDCPITLQQKSQSQNEISVTSVMLESGAVSSVLALPISEPSQVAVATHMVTPTTSAVTVIPIDSDNLLLTQGRSKK